MKDTALLLIGYQNDYFSKQGILRSYVEESDETLGIVNNTIEIIKTIDDILIISTPIRFSKDYNELVKPEGILKKIKEAGAFQKGKKGSKLISEFKPYEDDILEVPGKHGLNAFIGTDLDLVLKKNKIKKCCSCGLYLFGLC